MTAAGLVLTVLATVMSVDGGIATIDRGAMDGLRPGDPGVNHYELKVADRTHRVDVGRVEVLDLDVRTARLSLSGVDVKAGSLVEFEVPAERISDRQIIAAARQYLGEERAREVVSEVLDGMVADDDPALREELRKRLGAGGSESPESSASAEVRAARPPEDPSASMVRVEGGRPAIGSDSTSAEFFNEQPLHRVRIDPYWIDRQAQSPKSEEPRTFAQAQAYCAETGKRLPTEIEWETAMRAGAIERSDFYEWTASWYLPYEGNRVTEKEFGRRFRVLRGDTEADKFSPTRRRFMDPGLEHSLVGFRCARADD